MPRKLSWIATYAAAIFAIVAAITLSLAIAKKQSIRAHQSRLTSLAHDVLRHRQVISDQMSGAILFLESTREKNPCSAQNLERMRQLAFTLNQLVDVGYVSGNRLLCSSRGVYTEGIPLGPPDYLGKTGHYIRNHVKLPYAGDAQFRISESKDSGYAAIIHPELAVDNMTDDQDISIGIVSFSSRKTSYKQGYYDDAWLKRMGDSYRASWFDGKYAVAFERSQKYDYAAYAAIPAALINQDWWETALLIVPLGAAAGLALASLVIGLAKRRMSMLGMLKSGIRNGELFLLYQPVVDTTSGQWVGAEALVRWRRPDGELIGPDVFIPLAELHGLIGKITDKVIEQVMRDARILLSNHPDFHFAINLSADDFQNEHLVENLRASMRQNNVPARNIVVEATERVFMNIDTTRRNVHALRDGGIRVAIDDFGTGYSSLSYLTTLKVDYLKIDKTFVDTMGIDAATSHVVSHIIDMAKSLKLSLIAEGVETQTQADHLRERGVEYAQGWLFAKPMPIAELARHLRPAEAAQPPRRLRERKVG